MREYQDIPYVRYVFHIHTFLFDFKAHRTRELTYHINFFSNLQYRKYVEFQRIDISSG